MRIILLALFWGFSSWAYAQIRVTGRVLDAQQQPLPGATVRLLVPKTTPALGTATDAQGRYALEIPGQPAQVKLTVSAVGYAAQTQEATVLAGQIQGLDFNLTEAATELQTVEITGRKETDYRNEVSHVGSKAALPLRELPQAVSYITKELMQDQAVFRLNEAVRNFSGVNQFSFYNDLTVRGHRISGGDNYAQLVNGMRSTSSFWKQNLTPHLERIEVIKGPASALFGNTSPGGTVNRVTKKPLDEARQALQFAMGSFGNFRATTDFTGPMNRDKTLLYRLNLGYENAQSFRDLQYDKNLIVAPSVSFLPTDKTRVNFDFVYQNSQGRLDRGQAVFGNGDLYSVPTSRALNRVNDYLKEETYTATLALAHQFTSQLSFNAAYMRTGYAEDLLEHRTANTFARDGAGQPLNTQMEMQVFIRQRRWTNDNFSGYLIYKAQTGPVSHQLVAGYDYAQEALAPGGSQLQARGYRNAANTGFIATFNPARRADYLLDRNGNPVPNVAHFDLAEANPYFYADMSKYFYERRDFPPTFYATQGIYVQDVLSWGRLRALLALRQDYFTDRLGYRTNNETEVRQSALIPRVGLTYLLSPQVNLYATYVQGYQPQEAARINNPNAGGPFSPLTSTLWEAGAKTQWFQGRFTGNLAVYHLTVNGALYNAGTPGNPDQLVQIGQEVAKGVEVDLLGQLAPGWSLVANYAYNHATITQSRTEAEIGRQKPNAPRHQGNLWTKYVVSHGRFSGLGAGLGANFVSERLCSIISPSINNGAPQVLPGYHLFNAALYYQTGKFQLQLNLNNLANRTHWVGGYDYIRLFPGAPRNWLLTVGYTF